MVILVDNQLQVIRLRYDITGNSCFKVCVHIYDIQKWEMTNRGLNYSYYMIKP